MYVLYRALNLQTVLPALFHVVLVSTTIKPANAQNVLQVAVPVRMLLQPNVKLVQSLPKQFRVEFVSVFQV